MYYNQLVEVMLRTTEWVQTFFMWNPDGDCEISNVKIIRYDMIELSKCGGLYTKFIDQWQSNTKEDKKIWTNLRQHLIVEYETC